jgi:ankyrin repeat protein
LFLKLSPADTSSTKFIEFCKGMDSATVIASRDSRPGYEGCTLLHEACRYGCMNAVVYLIGIGHLIDCIDTSVAGVTPLMEAIQENQLEVVEFLMRSGVSLFQVDVRGENAMHYGARVGSRMCKLLLSHPEVAPSDYRVLLSTKNIKLALPEDVAANSFIKTMFQSIRETGSFEPPKRANTKRSKS